MEKLTAFGAFVRKARVDLRLRLKDMADEMGITSAYLSAVELGTRPLSEKIVDLTVMCLERRGVDGNEVRAAAARSMASVDISPIQEDRREALVALARHLPGWSEQKLMQLKELLRE